MKKTETEMHRSADLSVRSETRLWHSHGNLRDLEILISAMKLMKAI